jgi:hypothetical protein
MESSSLIVDKLYSFQENCQVKSTYQLPRSTSSGFSLARDQFCTVDIFTVDEANNQYVAASKAEVAAFMLSGESSQHGKVVELCVHYDLSSSNQELERFSDSVLLNFDDNVHRIKLLPLPCIEYLSNEQNQNQQVNDSAVDTSMYHAVGVLLVVATTSGVSARSIVLKRSINNDCFLLSELIEVRSNRRKTTLLRPFLYILI